MLNSEASEAGSHRIVAQLRDEFVEIRKGPLEDQTTGRYTLCQTQCHGARIDFEDLSGEQIRRPVVLCSELPKWYPVGKVEVENDTQHLHHLSAVR